MERRDVATRIDLPETLMQLSPQNIILNISLSYYHEYPTLFVF